MPDERKIVTVRFHEEEYKFLRLIAAEDGLSMGALVGGIVTQELDARRSSADETKIKLSQAVLDNM